MGQCLLHGVTLNGMRRARLGQERVGFRSPGLCLHHKERATGAGDPSGSDAVTDAPKFPAPGTARGSHLQEGQCCSLQQALCVADLGVDFLCREKTRALQPPHSRQEAQPDPTAPASPKQRELYHLR